MLIQVSYADQRFDYVKDFMLDTLIEAGKITQFRRSSGWVKVGEDPIRGTRPNVGYSGADRRSHA